MILFGVGSLRRSIAEHVEHDHEERPHQVIVNFTPERTVMPRPAPGDEIERTPRLGGLLPHDRRAA